MKALFDVPPSSEITDYRVYQNRRQWMAQAAPGKNKALAVVSSPVAGAMTLEKLTSYKDVTGYNNFYEFGTDKSDPAARAHTLKTSPWDISIEGLVKRPGKIALEEV